MDRKQVRNAIRSKRYTPFAGSEVTLPSGSPVLFDDIAAACQRALAYQRDITPDAVKDVQCIVTSDQGRITITWIRLWGADGNIFDSDGGDLDNGIQKEVVEKLILATKEAIAAIDVGNDLAIDSVHKVLGATEAKSRCEAGPNPKISANVGWRAAGPQVPFTFGLGTRDVGGIPDASNEFNDDSTITLQGCILIKWVSLTSVEFELPEESIPPAAIVEHMRKGKPRIRVSVSAIDIDVLRAAWLAGCTIDVGVSRGLRLKGYTDVLHVVHVNNQAGITKAARAKLDEIGRGLFEDVETKLQQATR